MLPFNHQIIRSKGKRQRITFGGLHMAEGHSEYLIVGGGLAGASAIEGIRERDP